VREILRKARVVVVLAVIASIVGIGGWQLTQLTSPAVDDDVDVAAGLTLYEGDDGIPLPTIEGRTVDGDTLDLAGLRGHVLVLNVWGSWCAPCRAEAPDLAAISEETASRGVRFVGIDVRDNPAAARAFARSYGITYPSFDDQSSLVLAQFTGIIPVSAVPSTLVVDRRGTIRARVVGQVDGTTLRGLIEDAERLG
jgi:thiol-disulfide isomerase/thioredoxin